MERLFIIFCVGNSMRVGAALAANRQCSRLKSLLRAKRKSSASPRLCGKYSVFRLTKSGGIIILRLWSENGSQRRWFYSLIDRKAQVSPLALVKYHAESQAHGATGAIPVRRYYH